MSKNNVHCVMLYRHFEYSWGLLTIDICSSKKKAIAKAVEIIREDIENDNNLAEWIECLDEYKALEYPEKDGNSAYKIHILKRRVL